MTKLVVESVFEVDESSFVKKVLISVKPFWISSSIDYIDVTDLQSQIDSILRPNHNRTSIFDSSMNQNRIDFGSTENVCLGTSNTDLNNLPHSSNINKTSISNKNSLNSQNNVNSPKGSFDSISVDPHEKLKLFPEDSSINLTNKINDQIPETVIPLKHDSPSSLSLGPDFDAIRNLAHDLGLSEGLTSTSSAAPPDKSAGSPPSFPENHLGRNCISPTLLGGRTRSPGLHARPVTGSPPGVIYSTNNFNSANHAGNIGASRTLLVPPKALTFQPTSSQNQSPVTKRSSYSGSPRLVSVPVVNLSANGAANEDANDSIIQPLPSPELSNIRSNSLMIPPGSCEPTQHHVHDYNKEKLDNLLPELGPEIDRISEILGLSSQSPAESSPPLTSACHHNTHHPAETPQNVPFNPHAITCHNDVSTIDDKLAHQDDGAASLAAATKKESLQPPPLLANLPSDFRPPAKLLSKLPAPSSTRSNSNQSSPLPFHPLPINPIRSSPLVHPARHPLRSRSPSPLPGCVSGSQSPEILALLAASASNKSPVVSSVPLPKGRLSTLSNAHVLMVAELQKEQSKREPHYIDLSPRGVRDVNYSTLKQEQINNVGSIMPIMQFDNNTSSQYSSINHISSESPHFQEKDKAFETSSSPAQISASASNCDLKTEFHAQFDNLNNSNSNKPVGRVNSLLMNVINNQSFDSSSHILKSNNLSEEDSLSSSSNKFTNFMLPPLSKSNASPADSSPLDKSGSDQLLNAENSTEEQQKEHQLQQDDPSKNSNYLMKNSTSGYRSYSSARNSCPASSKAASTISSPLNASNVQKLPHNLPTDLDNQTTIIDHADILTIQQNKNFVSIKNTESTDIMNPGSTSYVPTQKQTPPPIIIANHHKPIPVSALTATSPRTNPSTSPLAVVSTPAANCWESIPSLPANFPHRSSLLLAMKGALNSSTQATHSSSSMTKKKNDVLHLSSPLSSDATRFKAKVIMLLRSLSKRVGCVCAAIHPPLAPCQTPFTNSNTLYDMLCNRCLSKPLCNKCIPILFSSFFSATPPLAVGAREKEIARLRTPGVFRCLSCRICDVDPATTVEDVLSITIFNPFHSLSSLSNNNHNHSAAKPSFMQNLKLDLNISKIPKPKFLNREIDLKCLPCSPSITTGLHAWPPALSLHVTSGVPAPFRDATSCLASNSVVSSRNTKGPEQFVKDFGSLAPINETRRRRDIPVSLMHLLLPSPSGSAGSALSTASNASALPAYTVSLSLSASNFSTLPGSNMILPGGFILFVSIGQKRKIGPLLADLSQQSVIPFKTSRLLATQKVEALLHENQELVRSTMQSYMMPRIPFFMQKSNFEGELKSAANLDPPDSASILPSRDNNPLTPGFNCPANSPSSRSPSCSPPRSSLSEGVKNRLDRTFRLRSPSPTASSNGKSAMVSPSSMNHATNKNIVSNNKGGLYSTKHKDQNVIVFDDEGHFHSTTSSNSKVGSKRSVSPPTKRAKLVDDITLSSEVGDEVSRQHVNLSSPQNINSKNMSFASFNKNDHANSQSILIGNNNNDHHHNHQSAIALEDSDNENEILVTLSGTDHCSIRLIDRSSLCPIEISSRGLFCVHSATFDLSHWLTISANLMRSGSTTEKVVGPPLRLRPPPPPANLLANGPRSLATICPQSFAAYRTPPTVLHIFGGYIKCRPISAARFSCPICGMLIPIEEVVIDGWQLPACAWGAASELKAYIGKRSVYEVLEEMTLSFQWLRSHHKLLQQGKVQTALNGEGNENIQKQLQQNQQKLQEYHENIIFSFLALDVETRPIRWISSGARSLCEDEEQDEDEEENQIDRRKGQKKEKIMSNGPYEDVGLMNSSFSEMVDVEEITNTLSRQKQLHLSANNNNNSVGFPAKSQVASKFDKSPLSMNIPADDLKGNNVKPCIKKISIEDRLNNYDLLSDADKRRVIMALAQESDAEEDLM